MFILFLENDQGWDEELLNQYWYIWGGPVRKQESH